MRYKIKINDDEGRISFRGPPFSNLDTLLPLKHSFLPIKRNTASMRELAVLK